MRIRSLLRRTPLALLPLWLAVASTDAALAQSNLLVNGNAEAGTLAGWTDALGHGFNVSPSVLHSGAFSFWPGVTGPGSGAWTNELRQDVSVAALSSAIDAGAVLATFAGFGRTNEAGGAADPGRAVLEFRSATGAVLATYDTGVFQPYNAWQPFSDVRTLPAGTRTLRVRLLGSRSGGASTDCFFDDLALSTNAGAAPYCTAGTTSSGCVPSIHGVGAPSASAPAGFTVTVQNVEGAQSGLIFYGISGPAAAPWGTGTSYQCVKAPFERGPVTNAGGTAGACDGALALDWNQFVAAHPAALGVPFSGGQSVWAQGWFRDPPAPKTTNLSNGLAFVVNP